MNKLLREATFKEVIFDKLILSPSFFDPSSRTCNIIDIFTIASDYPIVSIINNFKFVQPSELRSNFIIKNQYLASQVENIPFNEDIIIIIRYIEQWKNRQFKQFVAHIDYIIYIPKGICIVYPCKVTFPDLPIDQYMIIVNDKNELLTIINFDNFKLVKEYVNFLSLYFTNRYNSRVLEYCLCSLRD